MDTQQKLKSDRKETDMATKPDDEDTVTEDGENGGLTEKDTTALETNKTPYWEEDE